jgi:hypothetical protein
VSGNTERRNTASAGRYKIDKQLGQCGMTAAGFGGDWPHFTAARRLHS